METTYVLNRTGRLICWLEIAYGCAVAGFFVGLEAYAVHRLALGQYASRMGTVIFGLFWFAAIVAGAVWGVLAQRKRLRFSAALTDEGVRVGGTMIPWESITDISQSASMAGPTFKIYTRDDGSYSVYSVEYGSQLGDLVRARLIASDGRATWDRHFVQYHLRPEWKARLVVVHIALACAMAGVMWGLYALSPRLVILWVVVVLGVYRVLAGILNRLMIFSVAVFEQAIRIGDVIVKWDEIDRIDQQAGIGVAFRVRTRDGRKLNVYSGLQDVGQLQETIKNRLASAGTA